MTTSNCVILDNGAGRVKYGCLLVSQGINERCQLKGSIPNCVAKVNKQMTVLVGDQMENVNDKSSLRYSRPFERGYMTNPHCQIEVWRRIFDSPTMLGAQVKPESTCLLLTEPPFSPEPIQNDTNEIIFEEFGFGEYLRRPAAWFSAYEFEQDRSGNIRVGSSPRASASAESKGMLQQNPNYGCCTVVDSGFSFTHIFPFVDGKCKKTAVKRVNVGGKLLTNYLKELVSLRQYDMADEFYLVDQVKEATCYVSTNFVNELAGCTKAAGVGGTRSSGLHERTRVLDFRGECMKKSFVLPDFQKVMRGFLKEDDAMDEPGEQTLSMETERFAVPEVLFHPSDIGMNQAGLTEATAQSLSELSEIEMGLCARNILLTGGNACMPQFRDRFRADIRMHVPDVFDVNVHLPDDPRDFAWNGASRFVQNETNAGTLSRHTVTRAEYLEHGNEYTNEKFFRNW